MRLVIAAAMFGTAVTCALLVLGWQSDEAWIPQVALIAAGWLGRSTTAFIKGE